MNPIILDKMRGSMLGGAVGDALGYPVHNMSFSQICDKYGDKGIVDYELEDGKARISDNTQMALFTANGLLFGKTRACMRGVGGPDAESVKMAYMDWVKTQTSNNTNESHVTWLYNIESLHSCRLTTNSCMNVLAEGKVDKVVTDVSDCRSYGGIVRVAPVGLYFKEENLSLVEIDKVASDITKITHGHDTAVVASAAFAHIINRLTYTEMTIEESVKDALITLERVYGYNPRIETVVDVIKNAVNLAESKADDKEAIAEIGSGKLSYEALAIAVYCSVKYQEDFEKAIVAAVNHDGASAATGAITGYIIGAYLGARAIPESCLEKLELRHVIQILAEDMHRDCPNQDYFNNFDWIWEEKYGEACYMI